MPNLMRDHVSLRKISRRLELASELFVKREIDVNLFITRTIEWPNSSAGDSTRRLHPIVKEHERWLSILPPVLTKHAGPNIFRLREDHPHELFQLFFFRTAGTRALHARLIGR